MKIVYYSTPWFMDCDLPLIKALHDKGHIVYYLLTVTPHSCNATILKDFKLKPKSGLYSAKEYDCLRMFNEYFPLDNWYIANQTADSLKSFGNILDCLKLEEECKNFIKSVNCDIFHVTGMQRNFNYLLSRKFRDKLVVTVHDPIPHSTSGISRFKLWTAKLFLKLPKQVVLLNKQQTDAFCERYDVDKRKVSYSHLGSYDCMSLFANNNNKIDNEFILFFGRIQPYKGVEVLIRAMRIVHEKAPSLRLVIAGKGNIDEKIDFNYTTFINEYISTEDLASLLNSTLFTVCPYISATQSGVVATAHTMKVPVIATKVGGMCESIKQEKTGILVEPNNELQLANAILELYNNKWLRNQIKENISHELINGYYSWNNISDIYIERYKYVVGLK